MASDRYGEVLYVKAYLIPSGGYGDVPLPGGISAKPPEQIRYLTFVNNLLDFTYARLSDRLDSTFSMVGLIYTSPKIFWKDVDGDLVSVLSDVDLIPAFQIGRKDGILRVYYQKN